MVNVQSGKGCDHWVPVREIVRAVLLRLGDVENLVLRAMNVAYKQNNNLNERWQD